MPELGFFMNPEGKVFPFGEWVEDVDRNNRKQLHGTSFEDEISCLKEFQSLDVSYTSHLPIILQAPSFARHGAVLYFNVTRSIEDGLRLKMFVPRELTESQKVAFGKLYPILCVFDYSSIYELDYKRYTSVDDFYREVNIPFGVSDKRNTSHYVKTLFSNENNPQ